MDVAIRYFEIQPKGPIYEETRRVRGKVLREPLGMGPVVEVFPFELESWHFVATADDRVVGCALFHPRGEEGRLYQIAVLEAHQRMGLGTRLVALIEETVRSRGIRRVFLHARHYVADYYARLGYVREGEPFDEIGITHVRMARDFGEGE